MGILTLVRQHRVRHAVRAPVDPQAKLLRAVGVGPHQGAHEAHAPPGVGQVLDDKEEEGAEDLGREVIDKLAGQLNLALDGEVPDRRSSRERERERERG